MSVTNPQPLWLLALWPLLPGVFLGTHALLRRALADRDGALALAPAFGIALWLVLCHGLSLALGDFSAGLAGATALAGLGGYGLWWWGRGFPQEPGGGLLTSRRLWLGVGLAMAMAAPLALTWAFHDELFFTGHMSIAAQLQNGDYPPHHLTFPQFELRYHYGFNILTAGVTALTRLSVQAAIDLLTVLLFGYAWLLFWLLGERVVAPRWGDLTAAVVLLGGGLPFFCAPEGAPLAWHLLGLCEVEGAIVNPPMLSYFFQHPWSLGIVLAGAGLHLFLAGRNSRNGAWYGALFVLVLALSIGQVVLFATLTATLVGASFFNGRKLTWRPGLVTLAVAGMAALVATQWGGVFAPAPDDLGGDLVLHAGMAESVLGTLRWHLLTFGLLLPLGLYGLAHLRGLSLVAGLLVAGSLVVVNGLRHAHSWDIAKFATVTALALSLGTAMALYRLAQRGREGRLAAALAFAGTVVAALLFAGTLASHLPGIPLTLFHQAPQEISPPEVEAINYLRARCGPADVVYRRFPEVSAYAQQAGLAQPWVDRMVSRHGFAPARIQRRMALLRQWPDDPEAFVREGIRTLVLDASEGHKQALANEWEARQAAHTVAVFGPLRIVELHP